ncbi:peptidase M24, structural domain-containing protein [Pavlovales sp. CCMP2436]|nr:peptidase M24, structural domain-containing protein [Pavlovales sp. CCMP2436]|mmetsp:Transcript_1813/g.4550  ORF Transcript_1813/g.4550 Transcript_1813/m.4550 type:complete len:548 (-) Transcript_1813:148-1791(-)
MLPEAKRARPAAGASFALGPGTYRVPMSLHSTNRATVTALLLASLGPQQQEQGGVILLQGGDQLERYDTDNEPLYRQESYFHYCFGVREAGCYGCISLADQKSYFFVPALGRDYEIVCGRFPTPADFKAKYGVDEVRYTSELVPWLALQLGNSGKVHVLAGGVNSDSASRYPAVVLPLPPSGEGQDALDFEAASECVRQRMDGSALYACAADARTRKSAAEVELMRYTYALSSAAHVEVMRATKAGVMEYQLEAKFLYHTYANGGARSAAYTCICASGPNGAVLHYGHTGRPNDRQVQEGDMMLNDMGCEYACYASDITCSYPVSGKFSPAQQIVYEAVLAAQLAVVGAMRPGTPWPEMHRLAERTMLIALKKGGLVQGEVEEMLEHDIGAIFMPHGLGHFIGIDTHDVGGYLPGNPARSDRPGLSRLRTARVLEQGMVITVEPGIYFIDALLDEALAEPKRARFLVAEKLEAYRGFGGVRIEDAVLVTAEGAVSLAACPRSVAEVEAVMSGGAWPPAVDAVPQLRRTWHRLAADGASMEPVAVPPA